MKNWAHWEAPEWAPQWLQERFPRRWTQAEVDRIRYVAHLNWVNMGQYIDPPMEDWLEHDYRTCEICTIGPRPNWDLEGLI